MNESFATKSDLQVMKSELEMKIQSLKADLSADIQLLRSDMKALESSMTIRLGSMMVVGLGVIAALIKMH